jgi:hypothetical protein
MRGAFLLVALLASSLSAGQLRFSPEFQEAELASLGEALADLLAFPNLTTAKPSGLAGFQVLGVVGGLRVAGSEKWFAHAFTGGRTLGLLPAGRLVARKGLPASLDVGVQVGTLAGERFWGGELRWALFKGGVILPAVGVAGSYGELSHPILNVRMGEVKVVVSKGFLLVSPYAGLGLRRQQTKGYFADAILGEALPRWHRVEGDRGMAFVGAVFHPLPLLQLVAEVKRGFSTTYFLGLGVGL